MSNVVKPPAESRDPLVPDVARVPGHSPRGRISSRWIWIALAVLALLCIPGAVLLALGVGLSVKTVGNPSIAADQYYSAIKSQDYATAYSYLGSRLKTVLSQQDFTRSAQHNDAVSGKVTGFSFSGVPAGNPAIVDVTVTRMNGNTYTVHLEWRQEGGGWKITALDRI